MEWLQYIVIIAILLVISLVVIKLHSKDFSSEVNKLVKYLGGKDNIINAECNMSRFKVILKDTTKVDKNGIQKLGAKGIVEIDNQLKIILGPDSKQLKKYMSDLK
jgi:glucose-like phosphotransferase system IIB component